VLSGGRALAHLVLRKHCIHIGGREYPQIRDVSALSAGCGQIAEGSGCLMQQLGALLGSGGGAPGSR